uniref:Uncharacterized protein n=1 Tax=viral metagenome TaxID=1070528 RepID=A0A6M3INI8_9ZZZZ
MNNIEKTINKYLKEEDNKLDDTSIKVLKKFNDQLENIKSNYEVRWKGRYSPGVGKRELNWIEKNTPLLFKLIKK